jgi:hypothetical protein
MKLQRHDSLIVLQTGRWLGTSEKIERCVADDCHILRPIAEPEAREVFAEDYVQPPVQAILDAPVRPHDTGEGQCTER